MARRSGQTVKGRGSTSTPDGRYLDWQREFTDDGWWNEAPEGQLPTTVTVEHPKTVISRNQSPDIPFEASINPYRGCAHGCSYCLSGDTPILMANGSIRSLSDIRVGDLIYGTVRRGSYRRYVKSRVLDCWSVIKPAYRITLADGAILVAGPDHRLLTDRGWKFVTGAEQGAARRPHLTTRNKLMGIGALAKSVSKTREYRVGYLCGLIRGDGHLRSYHYDRAGRRHGDQHRFRLAMSDVEAIQRAKEYLELEHVYTRQFLFQAAGVGCRAMQAIRNSAEGDVETIRRLVAWPENASREWSAGFLSGVFDAEGSFNDCCLRIFNTDREFIGWTARSFEAFGFEFVEEPPQKGCNKPVFVVRLTGGLREHLRFFHTVDPAISRKREFFGQAVKSQAPLNVVSIERLGGAERLYDITTETGDFIANGVISHNCYARPTHAYLDLSPGLDFETKLFVKPDAPAILRRELGEKGYRCTPIALGTNTDPYQPIEREWKVTRGIIEVLAAHDHPLTIVTKSGLVVRDIDLLAPMAEKNLVQVALSITTLQGDLANRMEPRAAAPARRLETLRRLSAAGIPTGVMFAPVIPFLNDHELEAVLEQAAAAGVRWAGYVVVRLPHEIKDLFREWLALHEPLKADRVMNTLRDLRGGRDNDPEYFSRQRGTGPFAALLRARFEKCCERLGLNRESKALRTDLFHPPRADSPQIDLF